MATPSQIRSKVMRINTFYNRLRQAKDRCRGFAHASTTWWQGDGGSEQRSEYREIEDKISRFSRVLYTLEKSIPKLADEVQKAINERRRAKRDQVKWA